jgi:hypothetical protein
VRNRSILAALVFSLLFGLSPVTADPVIERGIDVFVTMPDGKTSYDFAQNPIPAGFFCKGSRPFTGQVAFKGLPLTTEVPGQLGVADTVVERLDNAVFNAEGTAMTRIQFRALSLVSIAPIKTACGAFHAYVSLNGKQRVTTMSIHRTKEGGGSFVAPLAVDVRMTFIPVKPARNKGARKLELTGSFTFPASPIPWSLPDGAMTKSRDTLVVDTNGDLVPDTRLPGPSNFLAGLSPDRSPVNKLTTDCCSERVCHTDPSTGKIHCSYVMPSGCTYVQRCFSTDGGL